MIYEQLITMKYIESKDLKEILEYYFTVPTSSDADLCLLSQKLRVTARHED